MDESQAMLAISLVDLSAELCDKIRRVYAALPSSLRAEFPYLLARAEAEAARLARTPGTAAASEWTISSRDGDPALLAACEAALAWVDEIARDDGSESLDRTYWQWVQLMRAAVAQAGGTLPAHSTPPEEAGGRLRSGAAPGRREAGIGLSAEEVRDMVHRLSNDLTGPYALLDYLLGMGILPESVNARAEECLSGLEDAVAYLAALRARQAPPRPPPP